MTYDDDRLGSLLERLEVLLSTYPNLLERVRMLEIWQAWLKGAWASIVGAWLYLSRHTLAK
jgi:hypothetical protein